MIECIMIVFISRMTINYNHEINKSMHTCSKWLWWHLRQPILKFNSHRLQRIKTELHTATVSLSKKPVTVKRDIGAYAKVILKLCISQSQCQTRLQLIDKSFWSNVKMSWFKRESLSVNHSYEQQNLHDGKISFCCKKHITQPLQRMVAKKNLILVTMCSRVSQLTSDNHKTQFAIRLWSSVTDKRWKHHQTERWGKTLCTTMQSHETLKIINVMPLYIEPVLYLTSPGAGLPFIWAMYVPPQRV